MQMEYSTPGHGTLATRKENAGLVESARMAQVAALSAEEKKGKDVRILDISSISSVTDYFVIVSGTSRTHVKAIADFVEEKVTELGVPLHHSEGYQNGRWILLDFGDLVVHVMSEEDREFYNLERLWGDAREVAVPHSEAG